MQIDYTRQLDGIVSALSRQKPEWLIAAVSALFGFVAATALELIKPAIRASLKRQELRKLLYREITYNYEYLDTVKRRAEANENQETSLSSESFTRGIKFDHYKYAKSSFPDIYISLDEAHYLDFIYARFADLTEPNSPLPGVPVYFSDPKMLIAVALTAIDRLIKENCLEIHVLEEACPGYLKERFKELAYRR